MSNAESLRRIADALEALAAPVARKNERLELPSGAPMLRHEDRKRRVFHEPDPTSRTVELNGPCLVVFDEALQDLFRRLIENEKFLATIAEFCGHDSSLSVDEDSHCHCGCKVDASESTERDPSKPPVGDS